MAVLTFILSKAAFGSSHSGVAMTLDHLASNLFALHNEQKRTPNSKKEEIQIDLNRVGQLYERAINIFKASIGT